MDIGQVRLLALTETSSYSLCRCECASSAAARGAAVGRRPRAADGGVARRLDANHVREAHRRCRLHARTHGIAVRSVAIHAVALRVDLRLQTELRYSWLGDCLVAIIDIVTSENRYKENPKITELRSLVHFGWVDFLLALIDIVSG